MKALVGPVDKELHSKKDSVLPFDPQKYERKKIWFIIAHIYELKSPLWAVFQKHEDEFSESLKSKKSQYGVGLLTVSNPSLGASAHSKLTMCLSSRKLTCFSIESRTRYRRRSPSSVLYSGV